jgi:predicted N-acyltransferase
MAAIPLAAGWQRHDSITDIPADAWNALAGEDVFLRHEFLSAMERHNCASARSGWQPQHVTLWDTQDRMVGALPLYLKDNSWGEFVFDWGWANAYSQAGLSYYPKLVSAVPFTPATGARLLVAADSPAATATTLLDAALAVAEQQRVSSLHVLFPNAAEHAALQARGLMLRKDCQFHWHNHGYGDFEDFLSTFTAKKRKNARRERRRIAEQGIRFKVLRGDEPTESEWEAVFGFYSRTFLRRGRPPYLNRAFFDEVRKTMADSVIIFLASFENQPIAAAICFRSADTLYGRYWGSLADFHSLHFETCYYQGIDYCIREGLSRFEPGTQGEHKLSRGFRPHATWSGHWLADTAFQGAVADFLQRERMHIDAYMDEMSKHVPYRRETADA